MKPTPLLIYSLLTGAAMFISIAMYAGSTISSDLILTQLGATQLILFGSLVMISLSYAVKRVLVKKNLLRIPLVLLSGLFIASFVSRIQEITASNVCIICLIATTLYLLLIIITMIMAKQLYIAVKEVFG